MNNWLSANAPFPSGLGAFGISNGLLPLDLALQQNLNQLVMGQNSYLPAIGFNPFFNKSPLIENYVRRVWDADNAMKMSYLQRLALLPLQVKDPLLSQCVIIFFVL